MYIYARVYDGKIYNPTPATSSLGANDILGVRYITMTFTMELIVVISKNVITMTE